MAEEQKEETVVLDLSKEGLNFWHLIGMVQGGARGLRIYKRMLVDAVKAVSL